MYLGYLYRRPWMLPKFKISNKVQASVWSYCSLGLFKFRRGIISNHPVYLFMHKTQPSFHHLLLLSTFHVSASSMRESSSKVKAKKPGEMKEQPSLGWCPTQSTIKKKREFEWNLCHCFLCLFYVFHGCVYSM